MGSNLLYDFLKETLQRLFIKSPKYFRVFGYISAAAAILTGLPGILQELNISLPDWATILQNRIVGWASTVAFIMTKLTIQTPAVAMTKGGDILKKTDETKLPFTANAEQAAADKKPDLPTGTISDNK